MSLAVTHLGSGSRGNATLVESDGARVLIDQGFSGRQLERRLERLSIDPRTIDLIAITHHHGDHGSGARTAMQRHAIPIACNQRTADALGFSPGQVHLFEAHERLEPAPGLTLLPVPVEHSGADNVAFIASDRAGARAAVVTDLGSGSAELAAHLRACQHISIEANHDARLLREGPYPSSLKARIGGRGGHLSNEQTGRLLADVVSDTTRSLVLTHLSQKNNRPHLTESTVLYHIDGLFDGDIAISLQDGPEFTHWVGQAAPETVAAV